LISATLHLRLSRSYTPDDPLRWQNRLFKRLNAWMRAKGLPQHFGWTREHGKRKGDHLHLLVHVPCKQWKADMWAGETCYISKALSPHARLDGVNIMQALSLKHERSEPMRGLRAGLSRSLNRAARQRAGWKERNTLAELRLILHPNELN
jgi:hypothetical protein